MIDPNHDDLENYFTDVASSKFAELRFEEEDKAGCTLLFYYVGHGVIHKLYTSMVLN